MIARVSILLPFRLWIAEDATLASVEFDQPPYRLVVHPPRQVIPAGTQNAPIDPVPLGRLVARPNLEFSDVVQVRTKPGGQEWRTAPVDLFQVDINAPDFDRSEEHSGDNAPNLASIAFIALDNFLRSLRLLRRSPEITILEGTRWSLEYLDDDGGQLSEETGKVRRYGGVKGRFTVSVVTESVWTKASSPQPQARWRHLLLDAELLRMHLGPALVLAATAIETLTDAVLDHVAANASLPKGLWKWIAKRGGNFNKEPSFKERCGDLLKFLAGKSLKDESKLWQAFTKIKGARDDFVHQGILSLSNIEVFSLLENAKQIIDYLEAFLPQGLRTPAPEESLAIHVSVSMKNVSDTSITARLKRT